MVLVHIVITVWACVCFFHFILISGLTQNVDSNKHRKEKDEELEEIQQKTPLIDVPITGRTHHRELIAELTGSFVVIGTKKKFESGNEQYLPIERVITHPNMKGWSCDLALVHTFASLTADKIGAVMPLAGEKTSTSIEPNVTILSWGRIVEAVEDETTTEDPCCVGDKFCYSEEQANCLQKKQKEEIKEEQKENTDDHSHVLTNDGEASHAEGAAMDMKASTVLYRGKDYKKYDERNRFVLRKGANAAYTTERGSRYLSSAEILKTIAQVSETQVRAEDDEDDALENKKPMNWTPKATNWRRQLGAKAGNRLTIETFGFLNAATCKKMLLKAQPDMTIQGNEIVCYSSDDHYVNEGDSGAPVVRLGQLIAITVGGIKSEGNHVAVGMKLSYFCPWINENLPAGDSSLNCWAQTQTTPSNDTIADEKPETYKRIRIH
ncbi:unnamed protein product [Arctia plantaginis]|uniref:Peptidase S1 domain-containing protein n=1 Tax=Arctia plantaginis TaxID=874455 RepID=A0A8S0ZQJ1_ARCPL|nr:unnamed protein product [Arctia plantaginis]